MIVTVFTPMYDGMLDDQSRYIHVYEGRLSRERVLEIGDELGSGYARTAICGDPSVGWYISYCNLDNPPVPADAYNPAYGDRYDETVAGYGSLTYDVSYHEVRRT